LACQPCTYAQHISWGGRPFSRSIFGKCLRQGTGIVKIVSDSHRGMS
jgi:hypothetical protein